MEDQSKQFFNTSSSGDAFDAERRRSEVDQFLMINAKSLPSDSMLHIRNMLMETSQNKFDCIKLREFKSPVVTLILSIFLGPFGVDRFYLGQIGFGIAKIFLNFITCGIFYLVDIFLSHNKCRAVNFALLQKRLLQ